MSKELANLFSDVVLKQPAEGIRGVKFETHCHSHFSDGPELGEIVETLFKLGIGIWSLTDHNNSNAFEALRNGKYDLNRNGKNKYELEINPDGRSMVIHSDSGELALLRSMEYLTDKGEIGVHGYQGKFTGKKLPVDEAVKMACGQGGFVVINHPYAWLGIGFHGKDNIKVAKESGAIAIEKNGPEGLPLMFSVVRAGLDAQEFGLSLVAGGDAHGIDMYGLSGVAFNHDDYIAALNNNGKNHTDTVQTLIQKQNFQNYVRYLSLSQLIRAFI